MNLNVGAAAVTATQNGHRPGTSLTAEDLGALLDPTDHAMALMFERFYAGASTPHRSTASRHGTGTSGTTTPFRAAIGMRRSRPCTR